MSEPILTEPNLVDDDRDRRFASVARLYGTEAMARLHAARIAVVGLGGVGSWTAEALARSGAGRLALIDLDHVALGNTNRQLHALGDEFGRPKVAAMADRLRAINPWIEVEPIEEFVDPDNVARLLANFDAVLDCIDQASAKAALIAHGARAGQLVITAGAAGGRRDPTRIRCTDLARVRGDPLLASVRHRLRRHFGFPLAPPGGDPARARPFGVCAVHLADSDAPLADTGGSKGAADPRQAAGSPLACAGYGSSVVVTAPLGFAVAAACIDRLTAT